MKFKQVCAIVVFAILLVACGKKQVSVGAAEPVIATISSDPPTPPPTYSVMDDSDGAGDVEVLPELTIVSSRFVPAPTCPECPACPEVGEAVAAPAEDEAAFETLYRNCSARLNEQKPAWINQYEAGISTSKVAEAGFLEADKIYGDCAKPLADFVEKHQADSVRKEASDNAYRLLTELRLARAKAMYALVLTEKYPFGFPYSESYRHTMVDELVKFLVDARLEPAQINADLTGAGLAELRKRSLRELYMISLKKPDDTYDQAYISEALFGLCNEIATIGDATVTGLTNREIATLDCAGDDDPAEDPIVVKP